MFCLSVGDVPIIVRGGFRRRSVEISRTFDSATEDEKSPMNLQNRQERASDLQAELVEVMIQDLRNTFQESQFTGARKKRVVGLADYLLNFGFLFESLPAHDAPDVIGSEASFHPLLQKHCGDSKSAGALGRQFFPSVEFEKGDVFLGI